MAPTTLAEADRLQAIATLRAGEEVDAVFACTRKERQISRAGSSYLTIELRDRTGAIVGRAFRDADVLAGRFERGQLVRVRGRVERFREKLQIEVRTVARAEDEDPARFLPVAYRDLDELEGFLEHLAREVFDPGLRAPSSAPAPSGRGFAGHHAYLGGLLEHSVAVSTMALELCQLHPRLDRDLLLSAAIVHDLGKTREFTYGAEIERSDEGRLLGHVELGLRIVASHAPTALDSTRKLALEHCVILHHGPEPAAGQRFASAEALALQRLNALDASIKGAFEHGAFGAGH
jgi:3'-5' exoribonuclease